jgi:hypothetical protein
MLPGATCQCCVDNGNFSLAFLLELECQCQCRSASASGSLFKLVASVPVHWHTSRSTLSDPGPGRDTIIYYWCVAQGLGLGHNLHALSSPRAQGAKLCVPLGCCNLNASMHPRLGPNPLAANLNEEAVHWQNSVFISICIFGCWSASGFRAADPLLNAHYTRAVHSMGPARHRDAGLLRKEQCSRKSTVWDTIRRRRRRRPCRCAVKHDRRAGVHW